MNNYKYSKKVRPKDPAQVFSKCMGCGCSDLITIDVDVLCTRCDWNSFAAHVDSGGFDAVRSTDTSEIKTLKKVYEVIEIQSNDRSLVVA